MLRMHEVGRKIAARRKEMNMTQMELADAMGVSFQAVSNWERGNSMPDIAKLPELSSLLDLTIDDLLTDEKPAKLVQHILDGDEKDFIKEEKITTETVADVAPILTPEQTQSVAEALLDDGETPALSDFVPLAPFLSDTFLEEKIMQVGIVEDIGALIGLAPFLSEKALDSLVDKVTEADIPIRKIVGLAPFLSEKALDRLASRAMEAESISDLVALAPFLSDEALDRLAEKLSGKFSVKKLIPLAPFLSKDALARLARSAMASDTPASELTGLAPFLSKDTLKAFVDQHLSARGIKGLESILPFL